MRLIWFSLIVATIFSCKTNIAENTPKEIDQALELKRQDSIKVAIDAVSKSKAIREVLQKKIKQGFNGSAVVVQSGITLLDTAVGFSNFEEKTPLNQNSSFQLASISKTFTSVAVLKLIEEGKLSFDLTVKDYYPDFPYEGVTIRSLLSHRSGLPYYEYNFDLKAKKEKVYPSNQDLMNWFAAAEPKLKAFNLPDHFFSYNNTNFAILAALVEKASGKDFGVYLAENIFKPLGMHDTFVTRDLNDSIPKLKRTFGYQHNRKIPYDIFDNILGDKGVFSSTRDMVKWYEALTSEKLLSKEMLKEAYTPRSFEHPGLRNYGYGFRLWVNEKEQTDYIYHTGWWKGYNTIFFFDPREDFVIVFLSNRYNRSVYNLKGIIDILHNGQKSTTVDENILDE